MKRILLVENIIFLTTLFLLSLLVGCKKEDQPSPVDPTPSSKITLGEATFFSVDSACLIVPNVFTPNGDGYNDLFFQHKKNIDSLHITIRNQSSVVVFSQTGSYWDGTYNSIITTGRYQYEIYFRTTSLVDSVINGNVYLVFDPAAVCFNEAVSPKLSDMVDNLTCGFDYVTNEIFCIN